MKTQTAIIVVVMLLIFVGIWVYIKQLDKPSEQTLGYDQYGQNDNINLPVNNNKNNDTINNVDNSKKMQATLKTTKGDIVLEFFPDRAPNTVNNFVKLAKEGFYNGIKFHRVIAGFMIQGGDPLTKDDSKMDMWGTGGPGYKFNDEITPLNKNDAGTISMANAGPNTNGSQFFINTANNNFLDGKHTVFGKVVSGMDVVKAIEAAETGANDRPLQAIVINSIEVK